MSLSPLPPLIGVAGYKNVGKTTLVTKILARLKQKGIRVGVVKHDGHNFLASPTETDTDRYIKSGAVSTVIASSDGHFAMDRYEDREPALEELALYTGQVDLILVEGYKFASIPKWIVLGHMQEDAISYVVPDFLQSEQFSGTVLGLVVPAAPLLVAGTDWPVYHRDDVLGIVNVIERLMTGDAHERRAHSDCNGA